MENNYSLATTAETAENKLSELWKRPGGTFAKITGLMALGGIGYLFCKYALPFLVAAAANAILLVVYLCILAVLLYIVTSKQFRRALGLFWLQIMRKLYGLIVNIDPIAILQNGIDEMKKKLRIVDENVTKLESLLVSMKKKLAEYKNNFETNIRKRDALQKKISGLGDDTDALKYKAQLQLVNNEIKRGNDQILAQQERIMTSEKYLDIMKKLQIAADYEVRNAQGELSYRKDEYEQAKAQQKVMSSITSILKGGLTRSMEEEIAMEQVSSTINNSIAEINRLLDGSNDILVNFELNTEVNASKAEEIVKRFDEHGFDIFNTSSDEPKVTIKGITGGEKQPVYVDVNYNEVKNPVHQERYF